jgi:hypothetical protein
MPKAKLKFPASTDAKKLTVAAAFSNVKLGNAINAGANLIVECAASDVNNFLEMDRLIQHVKGTELDKPATEKAPAKKP